MPPTDDTQELDALYELIESELRDLLGRPHNIEEIQAGIAALSDLLKAFQNKDHILERLLAASAAPEPHNEIRQVMATLRAESQQMRARANRLLDEAHSLRERADGLLAKSQRIASGRRAGQEQQPPEPATRPRLLFVEDDDDNAEALARLLDVEGYEVMRAKTMANGARLARTETFGLIILDAWLPDGDGVELCRQVREFAPNIPVIFYSGAGYEADIRKGLEAGAQAYVVKPDVDELTATIMRLVT